MDGTGSGRRRWWKRVAIAAALLLAAWVAVGLATLPSVGDLATGNPETTALIEARAREAAEAGRKPRRRQHWVPLGAIAPHAVQAVIVSEDARFWQHDGVDLIELGDALAEAWREGELGRGASTITQQLAKNLWLSGERSLLRKGKELLLAWRLERSLSKRRILELYLNVVEWGPGVYGIEAAAREHFGVSAAALSPGQGAILAAMLPAPLRWTPARKPPVLRRRALRIVDRLEAAGKLSPLAAEAARAEIEARLGRRGRPAAPDRARAQDAQETGAARGEAGAAGQPSPPAAAPEEDRAEPPAGEPARNGGEPAQFDGVPALTPR